MSGSPTDTPRAGNRSDWISAIEGDRAPRSGVAEALRSTAVIEAAMKSVSSRRFESVAVPTD